MSDDEMFLNWFAGFSDGEGCFYFTRNRYKCLEAGFTIKVRSDDSFILDEIVRKTGLGKVTHYGVSKSATKNAKPQSLYRINNKKDCLRLVEIFDAHPLRAKKKNDYKIWRAAVIHKNSYRGTYCEILDTLWKQLKEIRQYR